MKTVIGIDLGTQSIKVLFYNPITHKVEASASTALTLQQDESGTAEQAADEWLTALADCFSQIPADIKNSATAIAVSGQQHGFVPLNKAGKVLAPVKLWCDTSTTQECDEIMQRFGGRTRCIEVLGNSIVTGYTASKILWLKKHKPESYQALASILLPHDYINFHLSGKRAMEYGDASGTGLLNIRTRQWDSEILAAIDSERDLGECLPNISCEPSGPNKMGELKADIAEMYGLPTQLPIANGGGDNMMAAIGTGNVSNGIVTISLGSSGTVYTHSDKPIIDKTERLAAFCSSTDGWLPLLCIMNCTLATELTRALFSVDLQQMEQQISAAPIGSQGVLTLPFFNGERSPNLPNAKGCILGLDALNNKQNNVLRSAMEGASFGLRLGIEALQENGIAVREIRLTGGGSNSPVWRQMLADICNSVVVSVSPDEGAAFGAALQALCLHENLQNNGSTEACRIESITATHVRVNEGQRCEPISANVAQYHDIYQQYKKAVAAITPYYQ